MQLLKAGESIRIIPGCEALLRYQGRDCCRTWLQVLCCVPDSSPELWAVQGLVWDGFLLRSKGVGDTPGQLQRLVCDRFLLGVCSEGVGDTPGQLDTGCSRVWLEAALLCLALGWQLHPLPKRTFLRYRIAVFCLFLTVYLKRQNIERGRKAGTRNGDGFQVAE